VNKAEVYGDPKKALSFIGDEPASEDKFGSHSRIVEAIIVGLEKQKSLRLIGLLGRWGTGKSTIVSQLAKVIEASYKEKYAVFSYDAWAHQGDPTRRSILEELIDRLVTLKLTKQTTWNDTLLEISGSTESSSTTTKTRLSGWGKATVALLLFIPIYLSFVDANTVRLVFADNPDSVSRALMIVLLFYAMLFGLVVIGAYAFSLNYALLKGKEAFRKRIGALLSSGEDILSIMLTRNFPATSSTTLRRYQPTAIESRRFLRKIVDNQRPRRIIFVIDNLDRIKPADALEIWSIMVGMVSDEAHRIDGEVEPVVILPFDPVTLQKIVPSDLQGHNASDLIEKSFDITFEVPPPVLSNRKSYFAEQYEDTGLLSWTGVSAFEQYWTVHHFEMQLGGARVTPRKINRFLNRVVALAQQQVDSFSPSVLSYYLANEDEIQGNCLEFLRTSKPDFDRTSAWQLKIAAIAFGTTEAGAAQVVLGDELTDALQKRDLESFKSLQAVAGFREVVRDFVENPPRDDTGNIDAKPITALAAFSAEAADVASDAVLWSRLWSVWRDSNFGTADDLAAPAVAAFMKALPERANANAKFLASRIVTQISAARDPKVIKELCEIGDQIASSSSEAFAISVGADADLLLRVLAGTGEESPFARGLRYDRTFEDLANVVLSDLTGKLPLLAPERFLLIAHRVKTDQVAGERETFFRTVGEGLRETFANAESPDATLIAATLILASKDGSRLRYDPVITKIEDDGTLDQAIQRATANEADAVVSALTALRLTAGRMPSASSSQALVTWLANDQNAVRLIGSMRQINGGSFLPALRNLEASGSDIDEILKPLIVNAVRKNDIGKRVHTEWLIKSFRKVASWLTPTEATAYAKLLTSFTGFSDGSGRLSDDDFLLFINKLPTSDAKELLAERIASFDWPRLAKLIFDGDDIWSAFNRLRPDIGVDFTAKSELFKALVSVLNGSMGELGYRSVQRALKFAGLLGPPARKQLVRTSVTSAIEEKNADAIVKLANVDGFGEYISRPSVAVHIITSLFPKFRRFRDGQRFIERHAKAISQAKGTDRTAVKSGLTKALNSREGSTADWARFVLRNSGLDKE
jgi:hypothetical protein